MRIILRHGKVIKYWSVFLAVIIILNTLNMREVFSWDVSNLLDTSEYIDIENDVLLNGDVVFDVDHIELENNNTYLGASVFSEDKFLLDNNETEMSFTTSYGFTIDSLNGTNGYGGFAFVIQGEDNTIFSQEENTLGTGSLNKSLAIGIESTYYGYESTSDEDEYFVNYTVTVIENGDFESPIFQKTTADFRLDNYIENGELIRATIKYDDQLKELNIDLYTDRIDEAANCNFTVTNVDLQTILVTDENEIIKDVYVGFTGATGLAFECCSIYDWYFNNDTDFSADFYTTLSNNIEEDKEWLDDNLSQVLNENNSFDELTSDLYLPEYLPNGSKVIWKSSSPLVLKETGEVIRPIIDEESMGGELNYYITNMFGTIIEGEYEYSVLKSDSLTEEEEKYTSIYYNETADISETIECFGGCRHDEGIMVFDNIIEGDNVGGSFYSKNKILLDDDYSFSSYFKFNIDYSDDDEGFGGFAFNLLGSGDKLGTTINGLSTDGMASSLSVGLVIEYTHVFDYSYYQGYRLVQEYYLTVFKNGDYNNPIVYEEIITPTVTTALALNESVFGNIHYSGDDQLLNIELIAEDDSERLFTFSKEIDDVDLSTILYDENNTETKLVNVGISGGTSELDETVRISECYFSSGNEELFDTYKVIKDTSLLSISIEDIVYTTSSAVQFTTANAITVKVEGNLDDDSALQGVEGVGVQLSTSYGQVYPSEVFTNELGEAQAILLTDSDLNIELEASLECGTYKKEIVTAKGYSNELDNLDKVSTTYQWLSEDIILNNNLSLDDIKSDIYLPDSGPFDSSIQWTISDEAVIDQYGLVTRPYYGEADQEVIVTGTINCEDLSLEKTFEVTVKSMTLSNEALLEFDYESLTEDVILNLNQSIDQITTSLFLPTQGANGSTISWDSNSWRIDSTTGDVERVEGYHWGDQEVTLTAEISNGEFNQTKEFIVTIKNYPPQDWESVEEDYWWVWDEVDSSDNNEITSDLELPIRGKHGSIINWASSNTELIDNDGTVNRPSEGDSYQSVKMTASISRGDESQELTLGFSVVKSEFTYEDKALLDYDWINEYIIKNNNSDLNNVTSDLYLPESGYYNSIITWESTNISVVGTDGTIVRESYNGEDVNVYLTATIVNGSSDPVEKEFSVVVLKEEPTDTESIVETEKYLTEEIFLNDNISLEQVTDNLYMPNEGLYEAVIQWESSNESVVNSDGTVSRPSFFESDEEVVLMATIGKGDESSQKSFTVTVKKITYTDDEIINLDIDVLTFDSIKDDNINQENITSNLSLPMKGLYGSTIAWDSSQTSLITVDGLVSRNTYNEADEQVTLTAIISYGLGTVKTKVFELIVLKEEITDLESVDEMYQALSETEFLNGNTDLENVIVDLYMPTTGIYDTTLSWETTDEAVISTSGEVSRPEYGEGDINVFLTCQISKGNESVIRTFDVIVKEVEATDSEAISDAYDYLTENIILSNNVSTDEIESDLYLPVSYDNDVVIKWQSSNEAYIDSDGNVTQSKAYISTGIRIKLTATLSRGDKQTEKYFYVTLPSNLEDYIQFVESDPYYGNEKDVPYTQEQITVTFDKDINFTSYKEEIELTYEDPYWGTEEVVNMNLSINDNVLVVDIEEDLCFDAQYKLWVPYNSLKNDEGFYITNNITTTFTTEDEEYMGVYLYNSTIDDGEIDVENYGTVYFEYKCLYTDSSGMTFIDLYEGDNLNDITVYNKTTNEGVESTSELIGSRLYLYLDTSEMEAGEAYTIYVPKRAIENYYGEENDAFSISFTTIGDGIPPEVSEVYPLEGSVEVDLCQDIDVYFSEPVKLLNPETIYLTYGDWNLEDFIIDYIYESEVDLADVVDGTVYEEYIVGITLQPIGALKPDTSYKVLVNGGAYDKQGDVMTEYYTSTFTTGNVAYDLTIGDEGSSVSLYPEIIIDFEEAIARVDMTNNITLTNSDGENVECNIIYDEKAITITPHESLDTYSQYSINIPSNLWQYESSGETNHEYKDRFTTSGGISDYTLEMDVNPNSTKHFSNTDIEFSAEDNIIYSWVEDVSFIWDLGDGTIKNGEVVTHQYEEVGEYEVTLYIDSALEGTYEIKQTIEVLDVNEIDMDDVLVCFNSIGEDEEAYYYSEDDCTLGIKLYEESSGTETTSFSVKALYKYKDNDNTEESVDFSDYIQIQQGTLSYELYSGNRKIDEGESDISDEGIATFEIDYTVLSGNYEIRLIYSNNSSSKKISYPFEVIELELKDLYIELDISKWYLLSEYGYEYSSYFINDMPDEVIFNVDGEEKIANYTWILEDDFSYIEYYVLTDMEPGEHYIEISDDDEVFGQYGDGIDITITSHHYRVLSAVVKSTEDIYIYNRSNISESLFLEGVSREADLYIRAYWMEHCPGYIEIKSTDGNIYEKLDVDDEGSYNGVYDLGKCGKVGESILVRAVSAYGDSSDWIDLGITFASAPPFTEDDTIQYVQNSFDYNYELSAELAFDGYTEGNISGLDDLIVFDTSETFGIGDSVSGLDVTISGDVAQYTIKTDDSDSVTFNSGGNEIAGSFDVSLDYEYNSSIDEWEFKEGYIFVEVAATNESTVKLTPIKIKGVKITPELTKIAAFTIGGTLYIDLSEDEPQFSGVLNFGLGYDVGMDISLLGVGAEAWGGGSIDAQLHVPTWYLQVDFDAYIKMIAKAFLYEAEIYYFEIDGTWNNGKDLVGVHYFPRYLSSITSSEELEYKLMDRGYLNYSSDEEAVNSNKELLKENLFPYPELHNVNDNENIWITYVDDDITRDDSNRTEIVLGKVNDDNTYEYIWIDDDGTCDFEPAIATNNNGVLVAWQDSNQVIEGDYDSDLFEESCEISVTNGVYESLSDEVLQITLTNDDIYDHSPMLKAYGEEAVLVWLKTEDDGSRIAYSYFDGNEWRNESLVTEEYLNIYNIQLSYHNQEALLLFTVDMDGDYTTEEDREIYVGQFKNNEWENIEQITDNDILDIAPRSVYVDDDWFITWIEDEGVLNYKWMTKEDVYSVDNLVMYNYKYDLEVNEDLGLITLLYKGFREDLTDRLMLTTYDITNNIWSDEKLVTSDYSFMRDYDSVLTDSGEIVITFSDVATTTEVVDGEEVQVPSDEVDLRSEKIELTHDLGITEPLELSSEIPYCNKEMTLTAQVDNFGDFSERAIVTFYEGDPENDGTEIDQADTEILIPAYSYEQVSVNWIVGDDDCSSYDIYVVVTPYMDVVEGDEDNNTYIHQIDCSNLKVTEAEYESTNDNHIVTVSIQNNGARTMEDVTVTLADENGSFTEDYVIDEILSLQTDNIDFIVNDEDLEAVDDIKTVVISVTPKEGISETSMEDNGITLDIIPTKLSIESQNVTYNSTGVSIDEIFEIEFDKLIQEGEDYSDILLRDTMLNVVEVDKEIEDSQLIITPNELLNYYTGYELIIPKTSIQSDSEYEMDSAYTLLFYTQSNMPEVEFSYPSDTLENIDITEDIRIRFSQNIVKATAFEDITLADEDGNYVAYSTTIESEWLYISPYNNFDNLKEYTLTIPVGAVKNSSDVLLNSSYTMTFKTNDEIATDFIDSDDDETNSEEEDSETDSEEDEDDLEEEEKETEFDIYRINNHNIASSNIVLNNDKKRAVVLFDSDVLRNYLESSVDGLMSIQLDVDELELQLTLEDMNSLKENNIELEIRTSQAAYKLDLTCVDFENVLSELNDDVSLEDINVKISITETSGETLEAINKTAYDNNFTVMGKPMDFEIWVDDGQNITEINKFNDFVVRLIKLPSDVSKKDITAGITIDDDGSIRQVPIAFIQIEGIEYVALYAMTNSSYMLVNHNCSYNDIETSYANDEIITVGNKFIFEDEEKFNPKAIVSRAELVKYLVKTVGLKPEVIDKFQDVSLESEENGYIGAAYNLGITKGIDETFFDPDSYVTREQAMTLVYRTAQLLELDNMLEIKSDGVNITQYKDYGDISDYAIDAVEWNIQTGLIVGTTENEILPNDYLTREQIATIIYRLLKYAKFNVN